MIAELGLRLSIDDFLSPINPYILQMNKIGLVLSGGGVRGVAHLGAIKALHEMGIEPDIVSGTSAGSIVSTMYAAGHSLDSIFEVFTNTSIFKMTHFATLKPGFIDSDKFSSIFHPFFPENDFSNLKKKCYVTATDIIRGRSRTFFEGEIIRPLLASCAVPVVFTPVEINGTLFTDGGALNNFPVEPLIGQCDVIIGVDVHPLKKISPKEIKSVLGMMERLTQLSVCHHSREKHHMCSVTIAPQALEKFGTFDRENFDEIFELGYEETLNKKEEILACLDR